MAETTRMEVFVGDPARGEQPGMLVFDFPAWVMAELTVLGDGSPHRGLLVALAESGWDDDGEEARPGRSRRAKRGKP